MPGHGLPPPVRRVGCTGPGRAGMSGSGLRPHRRLVDTPASKATKEKRVSAVEFGGREGEVKGLVESPVHEELDKNSAE